MRNVLHLTNRMTVCRKENTRRTMPLFVGVIFATPLIIALLVPYLAIKYIIVEPYKKIRKCCKNKSH